MFRSLLMADRDIALKNTTTNETNIIFFYRSDIELAEHYARSFVRIGRQENQGKIKGSLIKVHILKELDTVDQLELKPAGIFVLEPLSTTKINAIVKYGKAHQIITFSPFSGDVEKGILGGLAVETRVRPYINAKTLQDSQLRLRSFFLKVAKTYEK